MDCHPQSFFRRSLGFCAVILLFQLADSRAENPHATSITRAFRHDATLNNLVFVNATTGWAVGDRGTIWHTNDAGATWREQPSPVSCSLNAVSFIDAKRGWAVGGQHQPNSNATRGIILSTTDGGNTWQQLPQPLLPLLTGVKFFDSHHGIAFGHSASYSPSGVFTTRDGGNTWQPLPSDDSGNWLAGDFLEPDAGAVAGPAGRIATLMRRKVVASPLAASSLRSFRAMQLTAPTGGWAVGDGGLLLTTNDLGRSWQTPPASPLQRAGESLSDHFDLHTVAINTPHIWLAGAPGTRIFHSPDYGQTWQAVPTGQSAPLRSIRFIDENHGWAAGALGNILFTNDGGQSWQPQRTGARRAALLAIFADPAEVPLELLADTGAADGYIAAVSILCTQTSATGEAASAAGRIQESFLLAGAATANTTWRFPLPPNDLALAPDDLLQSLNRENDGRALEQIQSHLVRELRMWRPDVVMIPHAAGQNASPIAALIERLMPQCVEAAADPNEHPELTNDVGLAPWQVKKVYGIVSPGARGDESVDTAHFSPWLGTTLTDFAAPARALLSAAQTPQVQTHELKLLFSHTNNNTQARGLFAGITLAHGSEARRRQPELPTQDLEKLEQLAARRRNIEQLLQRSQGNAPWGAQVNQMIDGLSPDESGQLLVQLADGYRKAGRLDLAADTYFLFARRAPDHPLVDPALNWLVHFYASSEVAHRLSTRAATNIRQDFNHAQSDEVAAETGQREISQTSATAPANSTSPTITLTPDDRRRRAIQLTDYLKTARPAVYAEPSLRFAEVAAQRHLGFANPAKRFYLTLRQLPDNNEWRQCATTEEWLEKAGDVPPPKKLATCRRAAERPHLDGQLVEAVWNTADHIYLRDDNLPPRPGETPGEGSSAADVRITHDAEFLYVAITCPKAENVVYHADDSSRPRDADLRQHDRVSIRIDLDRDFSTAFELTVDSRGWTNDVCWGDAAWDPTWYVAAASDESTWTVEAAIPLAELAEKPPTARDVWAIAARRTIPRTGYQTWSAASNRGDAAHGEAASDDSPTQFGLLLFE